MEAVLCYQVEPVVATMAAFLILGEGLNIKTVLGGFFIIAGILSAELSQRESHEA
ncbi:MAG: DMT family transporter [Deltaproteobacteria bacterium]|nr:DMT family transporter [Deltaproteobacteria bacterium]